MTKGKNKHPELARLMNSEAYVSAGGLRQSEVVLPNGGAILVREFESRDYVEYMSYFKYDKEGSACWADVERMDFFKFVTHLGAINPDGSRMFPVFADMPSMRSDFLRPAADEILRLSGLKKEVADNLPNVKESSSSGLPTDGTETSET